MSSAAIFIVDTMPVLTAKSIDCQPSPTALRRRAGRLLGKVGRSTDSRHNVPITVESTT
jgi:hypothetical protein